MCESVQTLDFVELRNVWAFTLQVLLGVLDYKTEEYIMARMHKRYLA